MYSSSAFVARCCAKRNDFLSTGQNNGFFNHRSHSHTCHPEGRVVCAPKDLNVKTTTH